MIELQMKQKIQSIRSNLGAKVLSNKFIKLCEDTRIQQQLTNAPTLEQNGIVERTNRKLFGMARGMMVQAAALRFL